jgi:hypothetical protein
VKPHRRSWLTLIGFLVVTTLASSLVFAVAFAGVTAVIGDDFVQAADAPQAESTAPERGFSGIITDARCGPKHSSRGKSAAECARFCVANGSKYTMVDGDKTYELAGESEQISKFAGQRVTLVGNLNGETINVNSVTLQAENGRALR